MVLVRFSPAPPPHAPMWSSLTLIAMQEPLPWGTFRLGELFVHLLVLPGGFRRVGLDRTLLTSARDVKVHQLSDRQV